MNYHKTISQYRHWRDGVGEGREGRWGSDGAATSSFGGVGRGGRTFEAPLSRTDNRA